MARNLSDHPLHVLPSLVGRPLASPTRRLVAFGLDCLLLLVPTLLVGVTAAAISLRVSDPRAYAAIERGIFHRGAPMPSDELMRDLAPLLTRLEAQGLPPAAAAAVEEGELDKAGELLRDYDLSFTINPLPEGQEHVIAPKTILIEVEKLIPPGVRVLAMLGVPALYFAFFTRRGATPGKRLLRLRVVRLDGERLSWPEALERFVGYVHIPGTLFVGLTDLWRDPNRRLAHDRVAHTAVIRR